MGFIVDASFGHAQITPKALKRIGATGAILYAGCYDNGKNVTAAEFHALLDAGFQVGLVIENSEQDMGGGAAAGDLLGRNVVAAAKALGYDYENCALFTAADWNSRGDDLDHIDAAMHAFREHVPVPGIYGNSYAMDRCRATGSAEVFWQSDSLSFSDYVDYGQAHLWQRYNDPRAKGLPVDVNDINATPIRLMGEDEMTWTPQDLLTTKITRPDGKQLTVAQCLANAELHAYNAETNSQTALGLLDALGKRVATLTTSVAGLPVAIGKALPAAVANVDTNAIVSALTKTVPSAVATEVVAGVKALFQKAGA